ncbi:leucine-rich repeat domain-containing protein [Microbacterium sp. Leaf320]|uniref:leucine-rich repeat domain-containing protein n=1 Tax=Microbacterium sp. Leaf320 TaxID=1736334 RepID=UPI000A7A9B20|nr:leucine-rich repeat domain-containing protein [Microbacterium sp. Leaf320]
MFTFQKLSAAAVAGGLAVVLLAPSPANAADVVIPDDALAACITETLSLVPGSPLPEDRVAAIEYLHCGDRGIQSLEGIEMLSSLVYADLHLNDIADLAPLSGLTALSDVDLGDNDIADLSPLSSIPSLRRLLLNGNQISDLSPLSGLAGLVELELNHNEISSLDPLEGLRDLESLIIHYNRIEDVSPLAGLTGLTYLVLDANHIADISPVAAIAGSIAGSGRYFSARFQTLTLPQIEVDATQATPVTGFDGEDVGVAAVSGSAIVSPDGLSWAYAATGSNVVSWQTAVPGTTTNAFTGSIAQDSVGAHVAVPTTLVDDVAQVVSGASVSIDVLANDGLPGEPAVDPVTLMLLDSAGTPTTSLIVDHGMFRVVDGRIEFTADPGFVGTTSLEAVRYAVVNADGQGGSASIVVTLTGEATTVVDPIVGSGAETPADGVGAAKPAGSLAQTGAEFAWGTALAGAGLAALGALTLLLRRRNRKV